MKQLLLFFCLSFFFLGGHAQLAVDCSSSVPLTINYCYSNNDTFIFTYTSTNGSPLNLTIISGQVENSFDELVILDSDGVTNLNAAAPYGNGGDISGLTFQSTGDSISFSVSGDNSVSCASGSANFTDGIDYTVSCTGCDFIIDLGPDQTICSGTSIILNAESPFVETYQWYNNGFYIPEETESSLTVNESGNYSVIGINESCNTSSVDHVSITFVDCTNTGLIHINGFYDTNGDSLFDSNEINFTNGFFTYEMNSDGIVNEVFSSTGSFTIASFNETDTYDFAYYFYDVYQDCYDVSIASFNNISVANGAEITLDFPVVDDQSCEDIGVYLISGSTPRPGFNTTNLLTIENLGLITTSGTVEFIADDNLVYNSVSNVNPNYTITPTTNGFILDFVDLQPGFVSNIYISLSCPNTVPLGTSITNTATYTTAGNDTVAENNMSSVFETVIGSYDPNNIIETHGEQVVYADFVASDEYLYYLIRFQNIGTAEAIDVRIDDALDSQLDESTFQMLHSSHDNVVTRTGNQLTWQFDNINLPSESMDEDASNGFVYFKIKPQAGYAIGDIIPNFADIYFDANSAITTNTFNTEFVETLSINDYAISGFSMYPNPANTSVTITMKNSVNGSVTVFDIQGKAILEHAFSNSNSLQLDVSAFESGLYFVKLNDGLHESIQKLIVN